MIPKVIFCFLSGWFLVYLLLPGPSTIYDFPPLPSSVKSKAEGDTIQVPNVSAYYSFNFRDFVVPFYQQNFKKKTWLPFPPFRLNYPPEHAFQAIKDQTESTYLEELVYPFRESLFINGMEPFYPDGKPRYFSAKQFGTEEGNFNTKTTLRYYPSPLIVRIFYWFGLNLVVIIVWRLGRGVLRSGE